MSKNKYDIVYVNGVAHIEHHYCREWAGYEGCYGTNPDHGLSWQGAKKQMIAYHQSEIDYFLKLEEKDYD